MIKTINGIKVFAYRMFHYDPNIFDRYGEYIKSHPKAPVVYGRLLEDRKTVKVEFKRNTLCVQIG